MNKYLLRTVLEKCPSTFLLTYKGSIVYGTQKEGSDTDFMGICFPPEESVFGLEKFEQQEFKEKIDDMIYEGTVYSIQKFFRLAMNGNPNIIESLFVEPKSIIYKTEIGQNLIDIRHEFLSKKCYHSFTGYAYSQLMKLRYKKYKESHRKAEVEKYGYSLKNAYHLIRLLHMAIQILTEKDLTVLRPERSLLIAIRNGRYKVEEVEEMARVLEKQTTDAYIKSDLRYKCNYKKLNQILIKIMKGYYGTNIL